MRLNQSQDQVQQTGKAKHDSERAADWRDLYYRDSEQDCEFQSEALNHVPALRIQRRCAGVIHGSRFLKQSESDPHFPQKALTPRLTVMARMTVLKKKARIP